MKKIINISLLAVPAFFIFTTNSLAIDLDSIETHGFLSQGYVKTTNNNFFADTTDGTFEFNAIGINFSNQITDNLRAGIQFFARDLGDTGNNEIKIDWAYADYRHRDWLGLRFGKMKAPHGLYNETRDVDAVRNSIFLPQSVYPEVLRDTTLALQGVGLYGNIDLNKLGGLSYQGLFGTQTIDANTRMTESLVGLPTDVLFTTSYEVEYKYAASLVWDTPLEGLRFSGTIDTSKMYINQYFDFNHDGISDADGSVDLSKLENIVYSAEYTWNNLSLMAEYMVTKRNFFLALRNNDYAREATGWYAGGTYRFTDWFELGGYYSYSKNDMPNLGIPDSNPEYTFKLEDICLTARFDINAYWTLKLEAHQFKGGLGLSAFDNPSSATPPLYFEEEWNMYAANLVAAF